LPPGGVSGRARCDGLQGSDYVWAIAFAVPYAPVFFAFVLYPVRYGLWLGSQPELYSRLFDDPRYPTAVLNTVIHVGVSVNLKMILAFLLSGFFMRKGWWTKSLLLVFVLPWATPALPAYISAFDIAAGSGPKTFHVRRLKGSVDSVHTLDRDEVSALRRLRAGSTSPVVFVSERGGPLSPDMIARIVERAGQAAKLGFHVHPHMLRHATGYALANDGTDTRLIQDFLGHASIANTVRYTKPAPGRLAAVRVR
jgi:hypothetical protein